MRRHGRRVVASREVSGVELDGAMGVSQRNLGGGTAWRREYISHLLPTSCKHTLPGLDKPEPAEQ